jgi:hypothetical protein
VLQVPELIERDNLWKTELLEVVELMVEMEYEEMLLEYPKQLKSAFQ